MRQPLTKVKRLNPPKTPFQSNSVWLFQNIHTKQVIFSPHRVIDVFSWPSVFVNLQSKSALKQFPSPKRRMFPTSLRKDYWIPLVHAIFPTHLIANHVYKRLLDHRAWRLTSPPAASQLILPQKKRNQLSLNQIPTAIADLAHITHDIPAKMILNWNRKEERDWAKEWSQNIWHCAQGFKLSRGYRLGEYKFPQIGKRVRKELGWDGTLEPPRDLKEAIGRSKEIWEKMHAKSIRRLMMPLGLRQPRNPKPRRQQTAL
jgi:hypothetical protein